MKPGICNHFRGVLTVCAAGIDPAALPKGGLPCIKKRANGQTCEKYEEPTPEQIAADAAFWEQHLEKVKKVDVFLATVKDRWLQDRTGRSGTTDCPACGGKANWQIAQYNGHRRYACSTEGCVRIIE